MCSQSFPSGTKGSWLGAIMRRVLSVLPVFRHGCFQVNTFVGGIAVYLENPMW